MSRHLLMIEISKAGKHGLLLEESWAWDAAGKVWRCPLRPSGIPKYFWALLDQKLRQIEPMAVTPSVALTAAKERCSAAQPSPWNPSNLPRCKRSDRQRPH